MVPDVALGRGDPCDLLAPHVLNIKAGRRFPEADDLDRVWSGDFLDDLAHAVDQHRNRVRALAGRRNLVEPGAGIDRLDHRVLGQRPHLVLGCFLLGDLCCFALVGNDLELHRAGFFGGLLRLAGLGHRREVQFELVVLGDAFVPVVQRSKYRDVRRQNHDHRRQTRKEPADAGHGHHESDRQRHQRHDQMDEVPGLARQVEAGRVLVHHLRDKPAPGRQREHEEHRFPERHKDQCVGEQRHRVLSLRGVGLDRHSRYSFDPWRLYPPCGD